MLWVFKRAVSMMIDCSFEHPKQKLNLMVKKIFTILCLKFLFDSTLVTISSVKASEVELMIIGHLSYLT